MKKITVRICTGTTCFVMGASQLESLAEHLRPDAWARVDLQVSQCMGFCKDGNYGQAPFVQIDDEILSRATLPELVRTIEARVDGRDLGREPRHDQ